MQEILKKYNHFFGIIAKILSVVVIVDIIIAIIDRVFLGPSDSQYLWAFITVSAVGIIILLFLIQTVLYFFSLFYNKTSQNTPTRDDQTKWKMPISFIGGLLGLFLAVIGLIINYTIEAKAEDAFWASAGLFFTIPVFMFIGWVIDKAKN